MHHVQEGRLLLLHLMLVCQKLSEAAQGTILLHGIELYIQSLPHCRVTRNERKSLDTNNNEE